MEDVRQLVQEEGREARNLLAFHVAVDSPAPRVSRKPPRALAPRRAPRAAARLRSASAGRDKRSELRARYWALLFGDLQRAIGEIYNTVEAHENLNECQEVILVLENYTRDFKALGEWFRLKWEYDNTPPPQRPQSLAWEIRKTDFVRPESRKAFSVRSSPSVSGKNSPSLSGYTTPSGKISPVPGKASPGSGKISPRIGNNALNSPKGNIEFFSNKVASKIATKPEAKSGKDGRLFDIKEKEVMTASDNNDKCSKESVRNEKCELKQEKMESKQYPVVEIGKAKESANVTPNKVVIKSSKSKTSQGKVKKPAEELSSQAKATSAQLDAMENEFLAKNLIENSVRNDNNLNLDSDLEKCSVNDQNGDIEVINENASTKSPENCPNEGEIKNGETSISVAKEESQIAGKSQDIHTESPTKSEDNFADVSNGSSRNEEQVTDVDNSNATEDSKIEVPVSKNTEEPMISKDPSEINPETGQKEKTEQGSKRNKTLKDTEVETKGKSSNGKCASAKDEATQEKDEKMDSQKQDTKLNAEVRPTDVKPSRPAYSQAAAKPKQILTKPEVKTVVRTTTPIVRSKTVVEIPPNTTTSKPRPYLKRAQNQTNKCSYPFNLTTGRNTLFDTATNSGKVVRKTLQKPSQVSSGDNKQATNKVDAKKRPPRPASLKINEKGDKKETNAATEKLKDCDEYSSTDTLVTQIDMSRIESSESLKTLVPEDMMEDVANSVEVLNLDGTKNDNEGWLTVKSRRLSRESKKQSKSHWANRFNQPSATTSLPTLNTLSPKQETNPITESATEKLDRAKSEQPETLTKAVKAVKVAVKSSKVDKYKDPAMIRQKSDVTGLKTRSARSRANKKEKLKDLVKTDGELSKNRLHSSLESLTTGLARSQESTEDSFDFDKWKVQFKSTFKYLDEEDQDQIPNHNEILRTADPSEMSEIQEMTSQIEENEKKISWALDFQSEVDTRKLCEEEDLLNRQIMELQQVSDVELDTETDDTETDAEILIEDHLPPVPCQSPDSMNLGSLAASLEDQYETALAGMSWAERVDTLVVLEALVARDPGRAQQLHAKLSQGISRRGSLQDALRRLQAKQARAERQRAHYRTERAKRIHQLLSRVEEVKIAKNQLIEEKRLRMERRLQKAAENRDQHLKDIVRKAHDEEEKLREIAFIKQLELENKRHEFLDQCRSHTTRLRQMRRQRLNKLEQKAAREAAVGARRQAIEAARKLHVETLLERRKERDARVEELKELKKQERDDAAREKAEGVKSRLSALAAAAELEADALRSRIRDKQDASQQRLESHLQAIREKATCPRQATTSESHDQEKELQEETERVEQERREKEKQKTVKKRARKVKQKLLSTSIETSVIDENNTLDPMQPLANKLYKVINQLSNLLAPLLDSENDLSSKKGSYNSENDIERNNRKNSHTKINGDDDKSLKDAEVLVKKSLHEEVNDKKNIQIKLDSDERTLKDTEVTEKKKSKKNKRESTPKLEKVVSNTDAEDIKKNTIKNQNHEEKKPSKTENKKKSNKEKKPNANSPDLQICSNRQTSIKQAEIKIVDQIDKNELIPKIKAQNKVDIIITEEPKLETTDNQTTKLTDEPEAKTESSKKRNKKNRNNSLTNKDLSLDRPKLSKTSSVCSSLSDMSKASCKSDRKSRTLIDTTLLDRNLNELHRMAEKFDMTPNDLSSAILPQKIHLLKTIGQLLTVAAEREDLTVQLSAKSLTTAVTTVSRLISACQASASYFLTSNLCVHVVKLLSNQLEKDLQDPKESDLAKQLSNCLSIALDSIRYSMRVKEKEGDKADSKGDLGLLRSRAHTLISYICLCGCVSRAEVADDARDSVCTLLTLCADLCLPCDADVGTERASAIQSLRCALNKSLCGARAQLCMFYASQEPERTVFAKAAGTAKMLRAVAELDHHLVQEAFGEGGWPLEFRAAVARLLTQHAPDDKAGRSACDGHGQKVDQKSEEALVLDLIVLIGFVVVNNPQLQETISEGCSVVKTLCTLPANWLLTKPHCHILLPTLVALADSPFASSAIAGELSMQMLEEYMESSEAQTVKLVQVIKQGKAKKANKK